MKQSAFRLSECEVVLLNSVASYMFRDDGKDTVLVIELVTHRAVTLTGEEARKLHAVLENCVKICT